MKGKLGDSFIGVFPSDQVPSYIHEKPCALICNTDPHTESGEHWIALYISKEGMGEYFDSYGQYPLHDTIKDFLNNNTIAWKHNSQRLQSDFTTVCGQYCIVYILHRFLGLSMHGFLRCFTKDFVSNDDMVASFVHKYFSVSPNLIDVDFLIIQACRAMKKALVST